MNSADQSLKSFIQKVHWMMTYRTALKWAGVWLLVMGVAILIIRFTSELPANWWHTALIVAGFSFVPLIGAAWYVEFRRRPNLEQMRAAFDSENHAGGLVMAAAEVDTKSWEAKTANLNLPSIRWSGGRAWAGGGGRIAAPPRRPSLAGGSHTSNCPPGGSRHRRAEGSGTARRWFWAAA